MEFTRIIDCFKDAGKKDNKPMDNFTDKQSNNLVDKSLFRLEDKISDKTTYNALNNTNNFANNVVNRIITNKNNYKKIGIPELDILFEPFQDVNPKNYIVLLTAKNEKIESFIDSFKIEANRWGKVFNNSFSIYPTSEQQNEVYYCFEDVRILRLEEYCIGMSGWLPELALKYSNYIATQLHNIIFHAADAFYKEKGENTNSIDISPTNAILCSWLKMCPELCNNLTQLAKIRVPQKVYYKGKLKKLSLYFLYVLSRLGCNVLIDLDPSQNVEQLLSGLPSNIKFTVVDEYLINKS